MAKVAEEEASVAVIAAEQEDLVQEAAEDLTQQEKKRLSFTSGTCHLRLQRIVCEVFLNSMVELLIAFFQLIETLAKYADLRL